MKFILLKKIISLVANRATRQEIYLEVGAYFIKKGAAHELGEILYKKSVNKKSKIYKAKVVNDIYFDFRTNSICVRRNNRFIDAKQVIKR